MGPAYVALKLNMGRFFQGYYIQTIVPEEQFMQRVTHRIIARPWNQLPLVKMYLYSEKFQVRTINRPENLNFYVLKKIARLNWEINFLRIVFFQCRCWGVTAVFQKLENLTQKLAVVEPYQFQRYA